jgi:hypothetical protein
MMAMKRLPAIPAMALGCALVVTACEGSDGTLAPITVSLPADAQITVHEGDGQVGPVNSTLPVELSVRVTAGGGRPVEGARILWEVEPSSGTVTPRLNPSTTNAAGVATVIRRMGGSAGRFTTTATIEETTKSASFTSVAQVSGATRMTIVPGSPFTYGVDTVLTAVSTPYRVLLHDQDGVPVPGVRVTWTATAGTVSSATSVSDALGVAEVSHIRGSSAGIQQVRAAVTGLGGSPVGFSTTATPGTPTQLKKFSGDEQEGLIGRMLIEPFVVMVSDAYGNAIGDLTIDWSAESDTGSILLAATPTAASISGEARPVGSYRHRAGLDEGTYHVSAAASTVTGVAPVSFTFTATQPPPAVVIVGDWDAVGYCYWWLGYCGFEPADVEVLPGETVTWTWDGYEAHDVVFEDDPDGPASASARLTGTHQRSFTTPGTYRYRCTIHSTSFTSGMVGSVTVLP